MPYTITNGLCALADVKAALNITDTNDDDAISRAIDASSRLIETKCNRRFWQDPAPRSDTGCGVVNGSATVVDAAITAADAGRQVLDLTGHGYIQTGTVVGAVNPGVSFTLVNFEGTALPATGTATQALTISLVPRRFVSNDPWLCEVDDISVIGGIVVQSDYAGDGSFGTTWGVQDYQLEPVNGLYGGELWAFTKIRSIRSLYFPVWGGISYPKPYTQALVQVTAQWGWPSVPSPVNQAAIIQSISTWKAKDVPFGATPFAETGILRLKEALHPTAKMLLTPYMEDAVLIG